MRPVLLDGTGDARESELLHVVGARPNLMKAVPVVRALAELGAHQSLVHTGQHYDAALSQIFFDELGLPEPDRYLGIGSGTHGAQTGRLLAALEAVFVEEQPAGVVVYGDVNSTLAAALAASKLHIPVAHVEAGLRSFDRSMPEEINRVLTDAVADLHLVTSPEAVEHLTNEGNAIEGIHFVGNPMIDTLERFRSILDADPIRRELGIPESFGVVTLHRPANVDDSDRAEAIVAALTKTSALVPLVFPIHPRGRDALAEAGLLDVDTVIVSDPLGYLDFAALMQAAALVITDSGGIQEETTMLDVPCLTVRPNTERPITVTHGTNQLVEPDEISEAAVRILDGSYASPTSRPPLWDGRAGERSADLLVDWVS